MKKRVIILLIYLVGFFLTAYSQVLDSKAGDRQALIDLYNATDGNNWYNNSGWGNGNPSDSWYGIEVNSEGRVTRVDLFKNGLTGHLPESIGNLTKVRYFNIKNNYLGGDIPSSIGDMESLEWLVMAGNTDLHGQIFKEPPRDLNDPYHPGKSDKATNDFTGPIPRTIGNLKKLKRFELTGTSVTSFPSEIGNCTALEGIYISMNYNLEGETLPTSLGNLTDLQQLYMAANKMQGQLPSSLSRLTKLRHINLGTLKSSMPNNHFSGPLPDLSKLTELRSINLDGNDLSGEWPHYWNSGNFKKLNTLRATWNNFTGKLHGFKNLPMIRSFDVTGNKLAGDLLKLTSISSKVIIIGLGWNEFTGKLPQSGWPNFQQLRLLYLNNNNLRGNIPSDFISKIDNGSLRWINLQNNMFTSIDPFVLGRLTSNKLEKVDVSRNHLKYDEHIAPAIELLSKIQFIYNNQTSIPESYNLPSIDY